MGAQARSVIAPWYQLLCQKRSWRLDLIKSLVKSFAIDPLSAVVEQKTIDFHRYLTEALLTLEYKTQEEVLTLINSLGSIVSQHAYQALHMLDEDAMISLHEPSAKGLCTVQSKTVAIQASVVLGMAFVLRDQLKIVYGFSDG